MAQKPHRFAFIGLIVCFFPYDETSPVHGMSVYRTLFLFPDGFGNFLRAEAQLVDGQIVRSFPDPFNDGLLVFNKNIIAERKVAHSDEGKPCAMLNLPNAVFQLIHCVAELSFGKFSFPIPLKDFLEFAVSPDTGEKTECTFALRVFFYC